MSYTPIPGSLADRVCAYFRRHSDEELSADDIALKFDSHANSVATSLAPSIGARYLERVRNAASGRGYVYRAGTAIARSGQPGSAPVAAAADSAPSAALPAFPANPTPQRKKRPPLPVLDLETVAVEADVPLPPARSGPRRTDWSVLFARLSKPGLCSSPLPIEVKHSLKNAAEKFAKANPSFKFTLRVISETHLRIWRIE